MYLLFKSVSQRDQGIVTTVGTWMHYTIGYLPDTHKDVFDYRSLNAKVIDEATAKSWIFISGYRGYISVRDGTVQNQMLQVLSSEEATGTKAKYTLTDADKQGTVNLIKAIMRYIVDEIYDKRLIELNMETSKLESATWDQQKAEAMAFDSDSSASTPLLSALASARGITINEMVTKVLSAVETYNQRIQDMMSAKQATETQIKQCNSIADCHRLLHTRFEVSMSVAQAQDENITTPPTFDI